MSVVSQLGIKHFPNSFIFTLNVVLLTACATNPYTDRSQLDLIPDSYESEMGEQAYAQVLNDPNIAISKDPKEVMPVKRVAGRIVQAAKSSKYAETAKRFSWEVSVIKEDNTKNAFALPGGKIAVYTGIFPMAKSEAGLAAIMGHEVVHALAKHGAERMSQGMLAKFGLTAASVVLSTQGVSPVTNQVAMQAFGMGAQVGVLLPFSRKHESEADYVGLLLAAHAGYDPREAVHIWERMARASQGQPEEFMSTHPSHETRIADLQKWMPEALAIYAQSSKAPAENLPTISPPPPDKKVAPPKK